MNLIRHKNGTPLKDILKYLDISFHSSRVIYILPDIPAIRQTEEKHSDNGVWSDKLFTFAKLSEELNVSSGQMKSRISRTGRLILMQEVVNELIHKMKFYGPYAAVKGFAESMLELIAEIKHMNITPQKLEELLNTIESADLSEKIYDISSIYKLYREKIESADMADDIDYLHQLSKYLKNRENNCLPGNPKEVIVYGFYDFTQSQLDVLVSLDHLVDSLTLCIPDLTDLSRLSQSVINDLHERFGNFQTIRINNETDNTIAIDLRSFHDSNSELEWIFKEIKGYAYRNEYNFDEIAVLIRSAGDLSYRLITISEKYGIPVRFDECMDLRSSPYGVFINSVFNLYLSDFGRDELLEFLRSPVTVSSLHSKDAERTVNAIENMTVNEYKIHKGAENWIKFIDSLTSNKKQYMDPRVLKHIREMICFISKSFKNISFRALTNDIYKTLQFIGPDGIVLNSFFSDLRSGEKCTEVFFRFIRELKFLSSKFNCSFNKHGDYISLVNTLMTERKYGYSTSAKGPAVKILTGMQVRGVNFPVVFIANADENSVPLQFKYNPVLKNSEKYEINNAAGSAIFPDENLHYEKEEQLFNTMVNTACSKLHISYSYQDDDSYERNPSYFSDLIKKSHSLDWKTESDVMTRNFLSPGELLAHFLGEDCKPDISNEIRGNLQKFYDRGIIENVITGVEAERDRYRDKGNYSIFEGFIDQEIDRKHFRPTELEVYGTCPFRYFSRFVLGLKEPGETEDRLLPLDTGIIVHRILHDLFREKLAGYVDSEDFLGLDPDAVIHRYNELISEKEHEYMSSLSHLSEQMRKIESEKLFRRVLPIFIRHEIERIHTTEYFPFEFEKEIDFSLGDITITGKADRTDRDRENYVIVYDYKSSGLNQRNYFDDRNFQLPVYLAGYKNRKFNPRGGYYLSVRDLDTKGKQIENTDGDDDEVLEITAAIKQVETYVSNIRKGIFPPLVVKKDEPEFYNKEYELRYRKGVGGECTYCSYIDLCRVKEGVSRKSGNVENEDGQDNRITEPE